MKKAMEDGGYADLVVHDGVLAQRSVIDTLTICCRIVGHFKCSALACTRLK